MQNQEISISTWKDHIRKRPTMYIGDLRLQGFVRMLEGFFEEILEDGVQDPSIELGFFQENKISITIINTDTNKFLSRIEGLQKNEGFMPNIGMAVFITLGSEFLIQVNADSDSFVLAGQKGNFEIVSRKLRKSQKGIIIGYTADKEIFTDLIVSYEYVNSFLKQFSYLNPNLKIISTDKATDELQRNIFHYPSGIFKELDYFISQLRYGIPIMRIDIDAQIGEYSYKIGISYSSVWLDRSIIKTYAGNIETGLGGSLKKGILEGLISSIKQIGQKENADILINQKQVKEQLIVIASVRGRDFRFAGSVKEELDMPELKRDVRKLVYEKLTIYFGSNPKITKDILEKFKR